MENRNVLLINARIAGENIDFKKKEILQLLESLNLFPSYEVEQELNAPYTKSYLGKGKVAEISELIKQYDFDLIVCNFDLTPAQYTYLQSVFSIDILDRTSVILEIFNKEAQSKEARLQVQIANLKYAKNRLVDKNANYAQVTSGGLKNKGAGEKQINLSRTIYKNLIKQKEQELHNLVVQRKNNRKMRMNFPVVAIVGYTNAGKSTLLNAFLKASKGRNNKEVLQADRLFATLETATRLINIYDYPSFLLTDTVGFINDLPTTLVEAFKSTLEEINDADLLIQVVDISDPNYLKQISVTKYILHELGADNIPLITLYNKIDLCEHYPFIPKENELLVSLNNTDDVKQILDLIFTKLCKQWIYRELKVPFSQMIKIKQYGFVVNFDLLEDCYLVKIYIPQYNLGIIQEILNA